MLKYDGKEYVNPKEAGMLFDEFPQSTLYYWAKEGTLRLLDVDEFCEDLPLDKQDLGAKFYIEVDHLRSKLRKSER